MEPVDRVVIGYRGEVWVTVNLATNDVERIFFDDESVQSDPSLGAWCGINGDVPVDDTLAEQARTVAEQYEWPTTSVIGRCQAWRGADGGPANFDGIVLAALRHALDASEPLPSRSDLAAAVRLIEDVRAWDTEISQALADHV